MDSRRFGFQVLIAFVFLFTFVCLGINSSYSIDEASKVYKDIPVGFHRVNKIPLDDSLIINNGTKGLFDYIDNRTAYLGQRLVILM